MKLKLKSKSHAKIDKKIYEKIAEGWIVIKELKKNWFGTWVVILEKK